MKKSIKVEPKKRGRPATGKDPLMGFRAAPVMRASVVKWAEDQPDQPTLSEAIRRLVELGLTVTAKASPSERLTAARSSASAAKGQKHRAREMAGNAIDNMSDDHASAVDQASRKRRLLKGPEEFRDDRVDRPKAKKK